jgi:dihydrodipicolinate synthase/N-acetylneuraminate lyase
VNGIFVGGTSGFGPLLTDDQWKRLMEIARDEVPDSFLLLAGVIAPSTGRAIERIRFLDRLGFENMVTTFPPAQAHRYRPKHLPKWSRRDGLRQSKRARLTATISWL